MTKEIQGIAASSGIAIAKAFRLENPELTVEKKSVTEVEAEVACLRSCARKVKIRT